MQGGNIGNPWYLTTSPATSLSPDLLGLTLLVQSLDAGAALVGRMRQPWESFRKENDLVLFFQRLSLAQGRSLGKYLIITLVTTVGKIFITFGDIHHQNQGMKTI